MTSAYRIESAPSSADLHPESGYKAPDHVSIVNPNYVDPDQVRCARLLLKMVAGDEVLRREIGDLPTSPIDWFGVASRMATAHVVRRRNLLEHWIGNQPASELAIRAALKSAAESPPDSTAETPNRFQLPVYDAQQLVDANFKVEWLVKNLLVADQPGVVGGPKKGLKSNMMLDLAVSLASGLRFLDHFEVPRALPTLMLTGESGGFATRNTLVRVCQARGIELGSLAKNLFIGFELPNLGVEEQVQVLADLIREKGIKVVIIDPLYLCLTSGGGHGGSVDTKNLFEVGQLLLKISKMCLGAGATPLLVHHNKLTVDPYEPPELSNLAYAGIQEFARQWLLVGRRSRYVPGTGRHDLWLTAGGSVGHSGEWAVDIEEGILNEDFEGRTWEVSVRFAYELMSHERDAKAGEAKAKEVAKEIDQAAKFRVEEDKIIDAVRQLGGEGSKSRICAVAKLAATKGNPAIIRCEVDGRLAWMPVMVPKGKGQTTEMGVGLPELRQTPTNSDRTPTTGIVGVRVELRQQTGPPYVVGDRSE